MQGEPLYNVTINSTVKPVTRGHLNKCSYMTGVPSSQVHFNVRVHFGSQRCNLDIPTGVPSSQILLYKLTMH